MSIPLALLPESDFVLLGLSLGIGISIILGLWWFWCRQNTNDRRKSELKNLLSGKENNQLLYYSCDFNANPNEASQSVCLFPKTHTHPGLYTHIHFKTHSLLQIIFLFFFFPLSRSDSVQPKRRRENIKQKTMEKCTDTSPEGNHFCYLVRLHKQNSSYWQFH